MSASVFGSGFGGGGGGGITTPVSIANGGTGQTTSITAFAALAAMTLGQACTFALADNITNTAPVARVLQHLSSGTTAAGFGIGDAVDLQNASGTIKRALTDLTSYVTATAGSEESKRVFSLLTNGTLSEVGSWGWQNAGTTATLYVGPQANSQVIRTTASQMQVLFSSANGLNLTSGNVATLNANMTMGQRLSEAQFAVTASASTLTIPNTGNYGHISGTTTINFITTTGWQAGARIELIFDGALTLTHNAGSVPANTNPLRLVGSTNASVAAGSKITLRLDSTLAQWVEVGRSGA